MNIITLLLLLLAGVSTFAADTIRICTYNLLNYSLANEDGRTPKFKIILDTIRPDILLCQEVVEAPAIAKFHAEAMSGYGTLTFHDGPDTDDHLFFRNDKFDLINGIAYAGCSPRCMAIYQFRLKSTGDTLSIINVNLWEGITSKDSIVRMSEAFLLIQLCAQYNLIRGNIIAAGTFNFLTSNEIAYQLIASENDMPRMIDPLGKRWVQNNTKFARFYTHSLRKQTDAVCGGGTGGGMTDRFDYLFLSPSMRQKLINGSYTHFGNDGTSRINNGIDNPPNTKYSSEMAAALQCASDHLPVYADFIFGEPAGVEEQLSANTTTEQNDGVRYFDLLGRKIPKPLHGLYFRMQGEKIEAVAPLR
jgi:hypothetical protein